MTLKKLYKSIVISPLYWGRRWIVLKDTQYTFKSFWKPVTVYIDKWFIFDWASTIKPLFAFWTPMWTDTLPGALFHDELYSSKVLKRVDADQCFNELMIFCKVKTYKRVLYYVWVRMFWWITWYFTWKTAIYKK